MLQPDMERQPASANVSRVCMSKFDMCCATFMHRLQGLSHQVHYSGAHGSQKRTASSYILDSTRQMLHEKLSRETVPGTKLLFALASVADKLSPVLSNTVSAFYSASKQDAALEDHQTLNSRSTKPEWFTQQLHKAYHGLADICKPSSSSLQSAGTSEQYTGHQATASAPAERSSEHQRQPHVPTSLQEAAGPEAPSAPAAEACYNHAVEHKEHTSEPNQDVLSVQQTCSAQSQQTPEPQPGYQPPSKDIQAQPDSPGQGGAIAVQILADTCGYQQVPDRVAAAVALEGPFEHGEQPLHEVTHPNQVRLHAVCPTPCWLVDLWLNVEPCGTATIRGYLIQFTSGCCALIAIVVSGDLVKAHDNDIQSNRL